MRLKNLTSGNNNAPQDFKPAGKIMRHKLLTSRNNNAARGFKPATTKMLHEVLNQPGPVGRYLNKNLKKPSQEGERTQCGD